MKYLPPKKEGKTPKQAAIEVRNKLIAQKEAWRKWSFDPENNEKPKCIIWNTDETIEAINEFIYNEGKKELDQLLGIK